MSIITQLPKSVANQIAAGEVVGRPASVVKELIENSVDAGATEVKVIVKDAGRTLVQVIDNGKGMSIEDARLCFKRHATSKIASADDLLALITKGFRGEALASISSVAQVELRTKRSDDEMGIKISLAGSDNGEEEAVACADGTSFSIKNLFFNVPARRNFLKSDQVELRHIIDEFQRVALAHPEISFRLQHNGSNLFSLKPCSRRQRVVGIFGSKYDERLVPIEEETDVVVISGFVGKPAFARKSRGEQFLFVNGRYIKHPLMHKAIIRAYDEMLPHGNFPLYTIFLEVDPSRVDVNIHPTKIEAKFEEDQAIFAILRSTIKRGLGKHNVAPSLDFDTELSIQIEPLPSKRLVSEPRVKINPEFNPFLSTPPASSTRDHSHARPQPSISSSDFEIGEIGEIDEMIIESTHAPVYFQYGSRFIVTTKENNLIVIDAQRAHQRILFEEYLAEGKGKNSISSQKLLFPEPLDIPKSDTLKLISFSEELKIYGLQIEETVEGGVEVIAVPSGLAGKLQECIDAVLEALDDGTWQDEEVRMEKLAATWSKAASIPKTKKLTDEEMSSIIGKLFVCESPAIDPWGRSVYTLMTEKSIEESL